MPQIKTTTTQLIEITPEQLAEMFWEMDDSDQAEFFHSLFIVSDFQLLDTQMYGVGKLATEYGLRVMHLIGKYGEE